MQNSKLSLIEVGFDAFLRPVLNDLAVLPAPGDVIGLGIREVHVSKYFRLRKSTSDARTEIAEQRVASSWFGRFRFGKID